jgi:hypothetical protein
MRNSTTTLRAVTVGLVLALAALISSPTGASASPNPPDQGNGCVSYTHTEKIGTTVIGRFRITCSMRANIIHLTGLVQRGDGAYRLPRNTCRDCYSLTVTGKLYGDRAGKQKYYFRIVANAGATYVGVDPVWGQTSYTCADLDCARVIRYY